MRPKNWTLNQRYLDNIRYLCSQHALPNLLRIAFQGKKGTAIMNIAMYSDLQGWLELSSLMFGPGGAVRPECSYQGGGLHSPTVPLWGI